MLFCDLTGREVDAPIEPADPYAGLPAKERALMHLVEKLGYSVPHAAKLLRMTSREAHRIYWDCRRKIKPKWMLRDEIKSRSPDLLPRDLCALELVTVMGYSIGRAAKVLGVNKGHMVRRVNLAKQLVEAGGDPRLAGS